MSADIRKSLFKSCEGMARAGGAIRYTNVCSTRGVDLELAMVNFFAKKTARLESLAARALAHEGQGLEFSR